MTCLFVFTELPKIYKKVCEEKPKLITNTEKKIEKKAFVKCDQCHFKSSMVPMKMHYKNIHRKKATRVNTE